MIEDFGEKIHGAAKDRWEQYRNRLMAVPDGDLITRKLSEIFPEPNYKRLAAEGVDPWSLALIHAMRDAIPTKPTARRTASLRTWVMQVSIMRNAARMLLDGTRTREEVQASLQALDKDKLISGRLRAYELLGHDVSLKKFDIRYGAFTQIGRERFDGAQARWLFYLKSENLIAHAPELDAAIEDLQSKLNGLRAKKKRTSSLEPKHFRIYHYPSAPDVHYIGRKVGREHIAVFSFDSPQEARDMLMFQFQDVLARYEELRKTPNYRREANNVRVGPDYRSGRDVTPKMFSETFQLRGVQFGNYVEGPRRQADLNRAFDALMDLSRALGCKPAALSLDGTLGLAFGARGTGGRNPAAAHYEMMEQVINLTKANGAGSLAHEWFHGLDNAIGRRNGNPLAMATTFRPGASGNLTLEDRGAVEAIATLSRAMRSQPVTKRSVQADKYRSGVYYSMSEEIGARAFEVWLINRLEKLGIQNDYLANVKDEDVFEAEAALLNLPDSRYPYVKREEFEALDAIYDACFAADGAIAEYLGGMEEIHADLEEGAPAGEIAMSEPGLPEEAKQASFFDDWDDETEISFG